MLLMYIPSYKGLLYAVIFDEMSVLTNSGLLRLLPIFSKLSIFLRRRNVFKFSCIGSPVSLASFSYPFAKETGDNR